MWHLYLSSVTTWLGLVMWLSVAPFPMVITNEVLTPFASTTTNLGLVTDLLGWRKNTGREFTVNNLPVFGCSGWIRG